MTMKICKMTLVALAAAAFANTTFGTALAAQHKIDLYNSPPPSVTMRATKFHFLDLNHDGYVTLDDLKDPVMRSQFATLDRNHDHRLSEDEFLALR
jgi:hypothetical protein